MRVEGLMHALQERIEHQAQSGYAVIMYTPKKLLQDPTGKILPFIPFDIVGPYDCPEDHILSIVNLLDNHGIKAYNVQILSGILEDKVDITSYDEWCATGLPHRSALNDQREI